MKLHFSPGVCSLAAQSCEIGGPDLLTLDEAVREVLEYDTVIADPEVPYYGVTATGVKCCCPAQVLASDRPGLTGGSATSRRPRR
jgi:hypothetical protein